MKNSETWFPTKFILKNNRLRTSKNPKQVGYGSRLAVEIVALHYTEYIPKFVSGKLLDLGCGKVPLYAAYKNYITDSVCVDWKNTQHPNPHLDFECDLNEKLPFKDNEFETIILSDVLEHICEPKQLIQEISRILKKKGKFILNVPYYYWLHEEPFDYYRYTEFALRKMIMTSNLRIIDLKSTGGSLEIVTDILSKKLLQIPFFGKYISISLQAIVFTLYRDRSELQSKLNRFPFGYFLVAEKESD